MPTTTPLIQLRLDIYRISLKDYPQAFVGSAHTHFLESPKQAFTKKDFTFFENGSMNYIYQDGPCIDSGYFNGGQGDRTEGSLTPYEATCNFISVLKTVLP